MSHRYSFVGPVFVMHFTCLRPQVTQRLLDCSTECGNRPHLQLKYADATVPSFGLPGVNANQDAARSAIGLPPSALTVMFWKTLVNDPEAVVTKSHGRTLIKTQGRTYIAGIGSLNGRVTALSWQQRSDDRPTDTIQVMLAQEESGAITLHYIRGHQCCEFSG